jgi:hypothetical protein
MTVVQTTFAVLRKFYFLDLFLLVTFFISSQCLAHPIGTFRGRVIPILGLSLRVQANERVTDDGNLEREVCRVSGDGEEKIRDRR